LMSRLTSRRACASPKDRDTLSIVTAIGFSQRTDGRCSALARGVSVPAWMVDILPPATFRSARLPSTARGASR
jgi:hypothetical protein